MHWSRTGWLPSCVSRLRLFAPLPPASAYEVIEGHHLSGRCGLTKSRFDEPTFAGAKEGGATISERKSKPGVPGWWPRLLVGVVWWFKPIFAVGPTATHATHVLRDLAKVRTSWFSPGEPLTPWQLQRNSPRSQSPQGPCVPVRTSRKYIMLTDGDWLDTWTSRSARAPCPVPA